MEWIVAAALGLAGLVVAVGIWLGERDPVVRRYKPDIAYFFRIGRSMLPPEHSKMRNGDSDVGARNPRP